MAQNWPIDIGHQVSAIDFMNKKFRVMIGAGRNGEDESEEFDFDPCLISLVLQCDLSSYVFTSIKPVASGLASCNFCFGTGILIPDKDLGLPIKDDKSSKRVLFDKLGF